MIISILMILAMVGFIYVLISIHKDIEKELEYLEHLMGVMREER